MSKARNRRTFGETKNHLRESEAILKEIESIVQRDSRSRMSGEHKFILAMSFLFCLAGLGFVAILFLG